MTIETCRLYPTKLMNDDAMCQWFISEVPWPGRKNIKVSSYLFLMCPVSSPYKSTEFIGNSQEPGFTILVAGIIIVAAQDLHSAVEPIPHF